jgi:primosomal protein N' (replication factor Y)
MTYVEVAVAAPLGHTLTYTWPENCQTRLEPGLRLLVPLGNRLITGYLLGQAVTPTAGQKTKPVAEVMDPAPLFPAGMIPFFRWIADYYHYPLGEVIKTALPGGLTPRSGRRVNLTPAGRNYFNDPEHNKNVPPWLAELLSKGELSPASVRRLSKPRDRRLLEEWSKQGYLDIIEEMTGHTSRPKTETCVVALDTEHDRPELKTSEQKTLELLRQRLAKSGLAAVARQDLARDYSGARKALLGLEAKGYVRLEERRVLRDPFGELPPHFPEPEQLTSEQDAALAPLLPAIAKNRYAPFLLHGITGSGKTEVYLRAAAATLAMGRSVLVLVPEIALATQLEGHFYSRFGDQVALLHSGLSAGERFDQWHRLASGEALVVIGARSAVFAPLRDPGLIIVDEEHDSAFKQEDGLRYHGRDLAVLRASQSGSVVILGSATPSVTSSFHARQGKYQLLTLNHRIGDRPLPRVEVVDLQNANTVSGRPPLFTRQLVVALKETLARQEQSLIFLNRRGFASLMLCRQCGEAVKCRNCHVTLTLHQAKNELLCHYCGYTCRANIICPKCQSPDLYHAGLGTERVESELTRLFPDATVARLDRDTCASRKKYMEILTAVRQREIDILVGTQMITKGHHFPHVTLIGVVWADAGMGLPDFRAAERTFQLLVQVTGRAGRGDQPGRVILQTHQPEHYSITTAQAHAYDELYERELALRRGLGYPPFARLINIVLDGVEEEAVRQAATELADTAQTHRGKVMVLGPAPAPLSRLRGRYRWQILLKGAAVEPLRQLALYLEKNPPPAVRSGTVKMAVDVDPENML